MQTHAWKGVSIALFALLAVFVGGNILQSSASAQTSCPVSVKSKKGNMKQNYFNIK